MLVKPLILENGHIKQATADDILIFNDSKYIYGQIGCVFDGGNAVIETGKTAITRIHFNCEILGWTILSNSSGSITIDIRKATYDNYPISNSICNNNYPILSSSIKNTGTSNTWNKYLDSGDCITYVVLSVSNITYASLILHIRRI